jgi:hypothetical protein
MKGYARFELRIDKINPPPGDGKTHQVRVDGPTGVGIEHIALDIGEESWASLMAQAASQEPDLELRRLFGEALFKVVLGGDQVGRRWATSVQKVKDSPDLHGLRVALAVTDPALAMLPWELLFDPDREFVATAADRALARYLDVEEPGSIPASERLNILLVVQSPKGLPEITTAEVGRLQTSIVDLGKTVRLETLNNRPKDEIRNALLGTDFHVLHFLGHGKAGGLALTGPDGGIDPIDDQAFAQLFQGRPSLRLVVLSACHSAQADPDALFGGMGPALVRKQIPAVVAMQYPTVLIETAAVFSSSFYRALASGRPVDVAVNEARNAISSDSRRLATRDWSTPVLYLGTRDGRVLDLGQVAAERQIRGLKSLRELASRSEDVEAALAVLRGQVLDAEYQVCRLGEWLELEKELTSLAQNSETFSTVAKKWMAKEARRAGTDGGDPGELLDYVELPWETCYQQLSQFRTALRHLSYVSGARGSTDGGGTAFDVRAWSDELGSLGEQIRESFQSGTIATLDRDSRLFRDRVGEHLTEARNALRRELKGLSGLTAGLASRLE